MLEKSPIEHQKVPAPWTEYKDGDQPPFTEGMPVHTPRADMPQGPSLFLRESIGISEGDEMNPLELLLKLFQFFFDLPLLEHVVKCMNAYASQPFMTVKDENGKVTYKGPPRTPEEETRTCTRCAKWKTLTMAELKVFHGIIIKMGMINHKRLSHYWCEYGGFGDPLIMSAMKEDRFCEILANLTFMMPSDETIPKSDKLRKIHFANDYLVRKVQLAYNPDQEAAIDESMFASCSKYCPMKQLMKCKPIKSGIKVFCVVGSKLYMYNWEVFLGKDESKKGKFVFDLIYNKLIPSSWDNTGKVLYMDNYFTGLPLFCALRVDRAIFAVGPSKATHPAELEKCTKDSIPFQMYQTLDARLVGGKGFMRHAVQKLEVGLLNVTTWLDNRFIMLISTVHVAATSATSTVLRWTKMARA
jgi:hypothetical protein